MTTETTMDLDGAPGRLARGRPHLDAIGLVVDAFDAPAALTALELISSDEELLALAEEARDAIDRTDPAGARAVDETEVLSLVGRRALMMVAATEARSPDEVRRRAAVYARQRCDPRVAALLSFALEQDRRRFRMAIRELA